MQSQGIRNDDEAIEAPDEIEYTQQGKALAPDATKPEYPQDPTQAAIT